MYVWKCDMPDREGVASNPTEMNRFCLQNGFVSWCETSAKDNHGIEDAVRVLVDEVIIFFTHYSFLFLPF